MISVNNLSIHFTGTNLFENIGFLVNPRERIGLTGKNGAGKTTLLRILAGEQEASTGGINAPKGTTIGYLPQEKISALNNNSIMQESLTAFQESIRMEKEVEDLSMQIAERTDYESDAYLGLINRMNEINERLVLMGSQSKEAQVEKVLMGLGFERSEFTRPVKELSGGWQMRIELAKILLQQPDLILLDEPTNHLDIGSIQWLETFLTSYHGAVILVSHDRAFLDNVTNRTIEINLGRIFDYKCSYTNYIEQREEKMALMSGKFDAQQKEIAEIQAFVEKFRYKATKAKQVQSRIKMLEKMDKIELEDVDSSSIRFKFPPAPPSGKVPVETIELDKAYGDHQVLKAVDMHILKGEKIAFVGKNGQGKTTLSRIIVNDLDYEGKLALGHNVKIGYFAQNQTELLDAEKTVFQTIDDAATGDMRTKVRALLGSFLFSGETIDKKVKVLSGGEKTRLALCRMLLEPVNLLVLDEPTNHLDMVSKDILKSALLQYDGTLILVSHDRDFLSGMTDRIYEFANQNVLEFRGDINEWLKQKQLEDFRAFEQQKQQQQKEKAQKGESSQKQDYERRKQLDRERRKITKAIEQCETDIENIESQIADMDDKMANPEQNEQLLNQDFYNEYEGLKEKLEQKMMDWEQFQSDLENVQ